MREDRHSRPEIPANFTGCKTQPLCYSRFVLPRQWHADSSGETDTNLASRSHERRASGSQVTPSGPADKSNTLRARCGAKKHIAAAMAKLITTVGDVVTEGSL